MPFFGAIFNKIELFYFWNGEEKNLGQFSNSYRSFYPKNCHKALKNMGLGSGIRKKPIPDPGVKKALDPGSGSATLGQAIGYRTFFLGCL
jgi:hypothetical protein